MLSDLAVREALGVPWPVAVREALGVPGAGIPPAGVLGRYYSYCGIEGDIPRNSSCA
jgi:hypothetical protein